jgi:YD repeat-containing protein
MQVTALRNMCLYVRSRERLDSGALLQDLTPAVRPFAAWLLGIAVATACVCGETRAQSYADCKEAGGQYGDCQEPDFGPWNRYWIWGATALPNLTCGGSYDNEADAVNCARSTIESANLRPSWPGWCTVTWFDPGSPWTTYNGYYGWNDADWHAALNFNWTEHVYLSPACTPSGQTGFIQIVRHRQVRCPAGFTHWVMRPDGRGVCWRQVPGVPLDSCARPQTPNPVRITDRMVVRAETDFVHTANDLLRIERHFDGAMRSDATLDLVRGFGARWRINFNRSVSLNTQVTPNILVHRSPKNVVTAFRNQAGTWSPVLGGSARARLVAGGQAGSDRWIVQTDANEVEEFDSTGKLVKIARHSGPFVNVSYGADGLPSSVVDHAGRQLTFATDRDSSGRPYRLTVSTPAGHAFVYYWDGATVLGPGPQAVKPGDLTKVQYPDGKERSFSYGEPAYVVVPSGVTPSPLLSALTGVVNEAGVRISTYVHNYDGRVLSSEPPGGANRYAFGPLPNINNEGTAVTTPLGATILYNQVLGRVTSVDQPAGAGSPSCSNSTTYDSLSRVTSRTDFNNTKTCYGYDLTRNLETKRVEGLPGSVACTTALSSPPTGDSVRTVSTQWHPDWRLETRRSEPKLITTSLYNGQGATCAPTDALVDGKPIAVICSRTEQPTTDESGALGFAATATGPARTWTFTYNRFGQILTSNGPRGDVTDTATYEYYPDTQADWTMGDLKQITNPLGHITRFTRYNRHGQALQRIDPNGLVTNYTYDLRQRLTSVTAGSEATVYEYLPTGLLKKATLPDGSFIAYTYDPAQRLTQIDDHKGSRIVYTLDAMGNRINEQATDPGGQLKRSASRVIDALNRVQQMTGALQ